MGEDKSSSIEKNPYNNKNTIKQAQQPVKRPVKDHKEDSKVKTEVVKKKKQQKKQLGEQKQKVESMENWRKPRRRSKQNGQIQSQRIGRKTLPQYYNEK